jgi:hypothetical protein
MSHPRSHNGLYKAVTILLLLVFSLSPCSVKRDLLNIFDIEYIGTLNKVKTTTIQPPAVTLLFKIIQLNQTFKAYKKYKNQIFLYYQSVFKKSGNRKNFPTIQKQLQETALQNIFCLND